MTKRTIAAMIIIETDDPRLFPENIDNSTLEKTLILRGAVIDNLANLSRVVMVMEEEVAVLMAQAHTIATQQSGLDALFSRAPLDYGAARERASARRRP